MKEKQTQYSQSSFLAQHFLHQDMNLKMLETEKSKFSK